MMIFYAILNGVFIGLARTLNGRLEARRNSLFASWTNHIVGFLFLTALILLTTGFSTPSSPIPVYLYIGGAIGALYVTLNSFMVHKLGVTQATLLVIAGQLFSSVILDLILGKIHLTLSIPLLLLITGAALLVFGFYQLMNVR
jgi:bacterial/archaeal transporter family-2 protein